MSFYLGLGNGDFLTEGQERKKLKKKNREKIRNVTSDQNGKEIVK